MSKSSFSIRNSHPRELEFLDEYNMRKINLTPPSSGYSQSASLLAHNRMLLRSLSGVACTTPDTSKSQPAAYCFTQLKQGTCLIRLKKNLCGSPALRDAGHHDILHDLPFKQIKALIYDAHPDRRPRRKPAPDRL